MRNTDLDSIAIGTPRPTGDDWFFTPRPSEGLDDAEISILNVSIGEHRSEPEPPAGSLEHEQP